MNVYPFFTTATCGHRAIDKHVSYGTSIVQSDKGAIMRLFRLVEELYDDHRSNYGEGDYAWQKAKDEATQIISRQRDQEDRQSDLWNSRK